MELKFFYIFTWIRRLFDNKDPIRAVGDGNERQVGI